MAESALVPEIFVCETRVYDRDGLFGIAVFDREIAALEHFQSEGGEVTVRDRLVIRAEPVFVRRVSLAVNFVLTVRRKRHPETIAHRGALERRMAAERSQSANEELMLRVVGRVIAFHQSHARAVNGV